MNDATTIHYNATRAAWNAWQEAEKAYKQSSRSYHTNARQSLYRAHWVQLAAYELAQKAQTALSARNAYKAKEKHFERLTNMSFFMPET